MTDVNDLLILYTYVPLTLKEELNYIFKKIVNKIESICVHSTKLQNVSSNSAIRLSPSLIIHVNYTNSKFI